MRHLRSHLTGIDQGDVMLFSEFEDGGAMWTGCGPRERRKAVWFSQAFRGEPAVHLSFSLWDVDTGAPIRAELVAENVTAQRFEIVFRTWADTRLARLRVAWLAIGELADDRDWDV